MRKRLVILGLMMCSLVGCAGNIENPSEPASQESADRASVPMKEKEWNKYNSEESQNGNVDRANVFAEAMMHYQKYEAKEFGQNEDAKLVYLSECIKSIFSNIDWSKKPAWEYILED